MNYVVGFAFDGQPLPRTHVLLIEKNKPAWQKGKYNGVDGKIGDHDTYRNETPAAAMVREFREKTGVYSRQADWELFAHMHDGNFKHRVFVFESRVRDLYYNAVSLETEPLVRVPVMAVIDPRAPFLPNLRPLLMLALDRETWMRPIDFIYGDRHFAGKSLDCALEDDPTINPTYHQP